MRIHEVAGECPMRRSAGFGTGREARPGEMDVDSIRQTTGVGSGLLRARSARAHTNQSGGNNP